MNCIIWTPAENFPHENLFWPSLRKFYPTKLSCCAVVWPWTYWFRAGFWAMSYYAYTNINEHASIWNWVSNWEKMALSDSQYLSKILVKMHYQPVRQFYKAHTWQDEHQPSHLSRMVVCEIEVAAPQLVQRHGTPPYLHFSRQDRESEVIIGNV